MCYPYAIHYLSRLSSLGIRWGAIAQRLLVNQEPLAAVVLMSPVHPRALSHISMRLLWSGPMAYKQLAVALVAGIHYVSQRVRACPLFSASEATDEVREFFSRSSDESPWIARDLQGNSSFALSQNDQDVMPPVMVASGDEDQSIHPSDSDETGPLYQCRMHWVHQGFRNLMYDRGAPDVSDTIGHWVNRALYRRYAPEG